MTAGRRLNFPPSHPRDAEDGTPIGTPCRISCRQPVGSLCHCRVCHSTFRGPSNFDDHRPGGWCLNPASIGLVLLDGLWATAEGHAARAEIAERLAAGRTAKAGAR